MSLIRRGAAALLLTGVMTLTGCVMVAEPRVTRLPSDGSATAPATPTHPAPSPSVVRLPPTEAPSPGNTTAPQSGDVLECGGRTVTITAGAPSTLVGNCPQVEVEGGGLTFDLTGATVGVLRLAGQQIVGTASALGSLEIAGNDCDLRIGSADDVTVRGDGNRVIAPGGVGRLLIQGNGNTVAGPVSEVDEQGSRNSVG